jgi:hypothetical protein
MWRFGPVRCYHNQGRIGCTSDQKLWVGTNDRVQVCLCTSAQRARMALVILLISEQSVSREARGIPYRGHLSVGSSELVHGRDPRWLHNMR